LSFHVPFLLEVTVDIATSDVDKCRGSHSAAKIAAVIYCGMDDDVITDAAANSTAADSTASGNPALDGRCFSEDVASVCENLRSSSVVCWFCVSADSAAKPHMRQGERRFGRPHARKLSAVRAGDAFN
jgi:hypothetical protein